MSHMEGKKEAKKGSDKSVKPEVIHEEEIKKHRSKGTIKGNE